MIGGFRFMSLDKMLSGDNELISKFDFRNKNVQLNQEKCFNRSLMVDKALEFL